MRICTIKTCMFFLSFFIISPSLLAFTYSYEMADENQFPWVVKISNKNHPLRDGCSGFLISKKHAITASHCLPSKRIGTHYVHVLNSSKQDTIRIKRWIKVCQPSYFFADFYERIGQDIAIVELDVPANVNSSVFLFNANPLSEKDKDNLMVAGYLRRPLLRFANVELYDRNEPERAKGVYAIYNDDSSGKSDAGGPLFYLDNGKVFILGVLSLGQRFSGSTFYATAVSYHKKFINKYLKFKQSGSKKNRIQQTTSKNIGDWINFEDGRFDYEASERCQSFEEQESALCELYLDNEQPITTDMKNTTQSINETMTKANHTDSEDI